MGSMGLGAIEDDLAWSSFLHRGGDAQGENDGEAIRFMPVMKSTSINTIKNSWNENFRIQLKGKEWPIWTYGNTMNNVGIKEIVQMCRNWSRVALSAHDQWTWDGSPLLRRTQCSNQRCKPLSKKWWRPKFSSLCQGKNRQKLKNKLKRTETCATIGNKRTLSKKLWLPKSFGLLQRRKCQKTTNQLECHEQLWWS